MDDQLRADIEGRLRSLNYRIDRALNRGRGDTPHVDRMRREHAEACRELVALKAAEWQETEGGWEYQRGPYRYRVVPSAPGGWRAIDQSITIEDRGNVYAMQLPIVEPTSAEARAAVLDRLLPDGRFYHPSGEND